MAYRQYQFIKKINTLSQQIQFGAGARIGKRFVVIELDIVALAAIFEIGRFVTFGAVNPARTFPTLGNFEFVVIKPVMLHGAQQYIAVKRFIVRDDCPAEKPFADFREMTVKSQFLMRVNRADTVNFYIVIGIVVVRRLDQRIIFIRDDAVFDRNDANGTSTFRMAGGSFKIYCGESHMLLKHRFHRFAQIKSVLISEICIILLNYFIDPIISYFVMI